MSEVMSDPRNGFDPMLLAVIAAHMDGIVREMTNTLLRTGRSALLNTARDFSCSLVTAEAELVTAAQGLPIHCAGSDLLASALARFHSGTIAEGDAFLHNDPYNGNTHHADWSILVPVFWEGEHVLTAIAKAHQADCGNSRPTTYASYAADIYEEGALNFPCVRIQRDRQDIDDLIRMCRARIRVPEQWYGDYLATLGAARIGERRCHALLAKYGTTVVREFTREWFDYSERRVGVAISRLPAGTVRGSGCHDPVDGMPDGIPLNVEVSVEPEAGRITVDLRNNIDCVPTGFNESEACARSAAIAAVLNVLPASLPLNAGTFRRIDVRLRENCVAGIPPRTASCSVATTNVADRLISITQAALGDLGDGIGLGEGGMGMGPGMGVISGADGRRGDIPFINQLFLSAYGGPASSRQDGWIAFGVPVDGGLMYRDSVEIVEQKYPVRVEELRLMPDSEGAGAQRGAPGCRVAIAATHRPVTFAYLTDGCANPSRGVAGGQPAAVHEAYLVTVDGVRKAVPQVGQIDLAPGEQIVEAGGGGGGFGDPWTRDPELVLADLRKGFISIDRARHSYGVVCVTAAGIPAIDVAATDALRTQHAPTSEAPTNLGFAEPRTNTDHQPPEAK